MRIGDVFSLEVSGGFAYVQTIGNHPRHKTLWAVRVFSDAEKSLCLDATTVARRASNYTIITGDPGYSEKMGWFQYIGHAALPQKYQDWIPVIRKNSTHPLHPARQDSWWLDDGEKSWKLGRLSEEQRRLTNGTLIPPISLRTKIERGWDPDWEFKGNGALEFTHTDALAPGKPREARFFLIFQGRDNADAAAAKAKTHQNSWSVDVDEGDDESDDSASSYVVCVSSPMDQLESSDEIDRLDTWFSELARRFEGVFDGHEIPLSEQPPPVET